MNTGNPQLDADPPADYLHADATIQSDDPKIAALATQLVAHIPAQTEKIKTLFEWVRDEVSHSNDANRSEVTCCATEVLEARTGACYSKSHLLAALLRSQDIPAGLCYQTYSDGENQNLLHGLNAVFLKESKTWIRLDPRGNTQGSDSPALFDLENEETRLAFPKLDLLDNRVHPTPLPLVVEKLRSHKTRQSLWQDLPTSTAGLELQIHNTAADFIEQALPYLSQEEVLNNLPIGIALRLTQNQSSADNPPLLATINDGKKLRLVCLQTPPFPPIVYGHDQSDLAPLQLLADHFIRTNREVSGMNGPSEINLNFAKVWRSKTNKTARIKWDQGIYRLDAVTPAPVTLGSAHRAAPEDAEILLSHRNAFQSELGLRYDPNFTIQQILPTIEQGRYYLWKDAAGNIVSSCLHNRDTPNGAVIGAVYTPAEQRGKGYATALVAYASQSLLSDGKQYCCLYTDLANPTSNGIYQKIGYRQVANAKEIEFE